MKTSLRRTVMVLPNHSISKFILLTVCLYALNASSARAQLRFSVSQPTAIYSANSGGTVLIPSLVDGGWSPAVNIGFPFTYGCNTYSQFFANPNGWISLGTTPFVGNFNDSITAGWGPIIAPLWDDLETSRTGNVPSPSQVHRRWSPVRIIFGLLMI